MSTIWSILVDNAVDTRGAVRQGAADLKRSARVSAPQPPGQKKKPRLDGAA